jgi:hypothetical protein
MRLGVRDRQLIFVMRVHLGEFKDAAGTHGFDGSRSVVAVEAALESFV